MGNPISSITSLLKNITGSSTNSVNHTVDDIRKHLSTKIVSRSIYDRPVKRGDSDDKIGIEFEVVLDGQAFNETLESDTVVTDYTVNIIIKTSGRVIDADGNSQFENKEYATEIDDSHTITIADNPELKEAVLATGEYDIDAKANSYLDFELVMTGDVDLYDGSISDETQIGTIDLDGEWDIDAARVAPEIRTISDE